MVYLPTPPPPHVQRILCCKMNIELVFQLHLVLLDLIMEIKFWVEFSKFVKIEKRKTNFDIQNSIFVLGNPPKNEWRNSTHIYIEYMLIA